VKGQFNASGFNPALVDDNNPARHYTAYLGTGFQKGPVVGAGIAILREFPGICQGGCSLQDVRLGLIGSSHGSQLGVNGPQMNYGVNPASRFNVANWIRRDL
jgi:hypothetical protein